MREFKAVAKELQQNECYKEEVVRLPLRATKTSGGYDFYTPVDLYIQPQQKVFFWTDVCVEMPEDEVLLLDIRSSLGIKYDLMLANTIPVIDSDYINATNGGNIGIELRNLRPDIAIDGYTPIMADVLAVENDNIVLDLSTGQAKVEQRMPILVPRVMNLVEQNTIFIPKGERVCQGIFVKYQVANNCNSDNERTGGFGSTTEA